MSRPAENARPSRRKKIIRLTIFALVSLIVLLYSGMIVAYVYFTIQDAHSVVCCNTPADWGAASYQVVALTSEDGITLVGWYVPPANGSVIILLHGYGSNRLGMGEHAAFLTEADYGVLMLDMRAHGESSGDRRMNGWPDTVDVAAQVDFLMQQPDVERIGILGFSTGAQVAARAAADLPQIEAIVLDGPSPATARDIRPLADDHVLFAFWYVTYHLFDQALSWTLDIDVPEAVVEALARIEDRPVLVIAGAKERPEPDYGNAYRDALGDNGDLWLIAGATHGTTWLAAPDYGERVIAFFDAAFAG